METTEYRWKARPVLAAIVRCVAVATPLLASLFTLSLFNQAFDRPSSAVGVVGWLVGGSLLAMVVVVGVDRLTRRLLPLAALLKLSMLLPDRAPSRFGIALRAGSSRRLAAQVERVRRLDTEVPRGEAVTTILALMSSLNMHDRATRGHCERVRAYTEVMAEELHLPPRDRDLLRWASLLHDIGKVKVPNKLLNKAGKPSDDEWVQLRRHPEEGDKLIAPLREWLDHWADSVPQHHERWDGAGYPLGLGGEDLCIGGRIVAVADAYETMTATRAYSRPISPAAAREELARCAGSHFDPGMVRAFLSVSVGRLRLIMGPLSFLAQLPLLGALEHAAVRAVAVGGNAAAVGATSATTAAGLATLSMSGIVMPLPLSIGTATATIFSTPPAFNESVSASAGEQAAAGATLDDDAPMGPGANGDAGVALPRSGDTPAPLRTSVTSGPDSTEPDDAPALSSVDGPALPALSGAVAAAAPQASTTRTAPSRPTTAPESAANPEATPERTPKPAPAPIPTPAPAPTPTPAPAPAPRSAPDTPAPAAKPKPAPAAAPRPAPDAPAPAAASRPAPAPKPPSGPAASAAQDERPSGTPRSEQRHDDDRDRDDDDD